MRKDTDFDFSTPSWLLPGGGVNEVEFCRSFVMDHSLAYCGGSFFGVEGRIADEEQLRREIYNTLREYVQRGLSGKVENIFHALKLECSAEGLRERPEDIFCVPVANGTYRLDLQQLNPTKYLCRYRLPVAYNPEAAQPKQWLAFLQDLLEPEDIVTLQEYLGYCLVPSTLAQKMLIITGRGGEGKSRIGVVMKHLLGDNMNQGSIAKVEASPFARADLQNLLLMVDDDLRMDALKGTAYLKSIITSEIPMDLEKKGIQSYQGKLNVRFLAFGNDTLQALHDRSHGFFRRQIILTAKEKSPGRKDDPYLAYGLVQELEGILLWCIAGLERLIIHDFQFTLSKQARKNLLESMVKGCNIPEFLKSQGYICLDPKAHISSRELYRLYQEWCGDNALPPLGQQTFWNFLSQNQKTYNVTLSRYIPIGGGRTARGYQGIAPASRI